MMGRLKRVEPVETATPEKKKRGRKKKEEITVKAPDAETVSLVLKLSRETRDAYKEACDKVYRPMSNQSEYLIQSFIEAKGSPVEISP